MARPVTSRKGFLFAAFVVTVSLLFAGCMGGGGGGSSAGSGVPSRVEFATMQHLSIDPSQGGEIIDISGSLDRELGTGTEIWALDVEYKPCADCGTQMISVKVPVE